MALADPRTKVIDIVFPIVHSKELGGEFKYQRLEGTGFLIGKNGFAITAAHVADQLKIGEAFGLFAKDQKWAGYKIVEKESHKSEDVALVKLDNLQRQSFIQIQREEEYYAKAYQAWGYPLEVAEETKYERTSSEEVLFDRPDLIFTKGYVRRRISRPLGQSIYRGKAFFELSDVAGDGCSGGPVLSMVGEVWKAMGIYIGSHNRFALAVRSAAVCDWEPSILGHSIYSESVS